MTISWIKFDGITYPFPAYINQSEDCRFARDYIPGIGYKGCQTNDLVLNFKQDISKKGSGSWQYRQWALNVFADELASIFGSNSQSFVTNIPTSKPRTSNQYDFRFEDMFQALKMKRPNLNIIYPLDVGTVQVASHHGGSRSVSTLSSNLVFAGLPNPHPDRIILVDDVVTSGSHFRACNDFLVSNGFQGQIIGLFWARTINSANSTTSAADDFQPV